MARDTGWEPAGVVSDCEKHPIHLSTSLSRWFQEVYRNSAGDLVFSFVFR